MTVNRSHFIVQYSKKVFSSRSSSDFSKRKNYYNQYSISGLAFYPKPHPKNCDGPIDISLYRVINLCDEENRLKAENAHGSLSEGKGEPSPETESIFHFWGEIDVFLGRTNLTT